MNLMQQAELRHVKFKTPFSKTFGTVQKIHTLLTGNQKLFIFLRPSVALPEIPRITEISCKVPCRTAISYLWGAQPGTHNFSL